MDNNGFTHCSSNILGSNFAKVGYDKWYGPMGRNLTFEMYLESILSSKAGKAIQKVQGDHATVEEMQELRRSLDMMQKCQFKKVL